MAFGQAATLGERNQHYARITGYQSYRNAHKLDLAHAAYYSAWYMPAIRELAARSDFRSEPAWIAQQLVPVISTTEAARALETLLELGLLVRETDGRVHQADVLLSTGAETRGLHIASYHRTMMQRAMESLDLVAPHQRDISSLTPCLGEQGLRAFKERVQRFRKELLELSALETAPEQVVQINFQLFPLSKRRDEGDA